MEVNCLIHQRPVYYFCLNKLCKSDSFLCILCLKKQHKFCTEQHIISKGILNSIKIEDKGTDFLEPFINLIDELKQKYHPLIENTFQNLSLDSKKKLQLTKYYKEDLIFMNRIKELKKNYDIKINKKYKNLKDSKIMLEPKTLSIIQKEDDIREAKNSMYKNIDGCFKELQGIQIFQSMYKIDIAKFFVPRDITFERRDKKFILDPTKQGIVILRPVCQSIFYKIKFIKKEDSKTVSNFNIGFVKKKVI